MIRRTPLLEKFEMEYLRRPVDYEENVRFFEAAIAHARVLGVWPPSNPLESLETDLRVAKALNANVTPR
ncbi:MAG: hypothetical protein IH851_10870 [Armatimonadetes bacterium]|nr:hypothetical protein [Armatimonadota bacterium]